MRESHRYRDGQKLRNRRKSLSAFLEMESVGAICEEIPRKEILIWKARVEERDRNRGMEHLNEHPEFSGVKRNRQRKTRSGGSQ
jgi:hypothetical protein